MVEQAPSISPPRFVTHEEFSRFESGITRWQEDVRQENRTFQEDLRTSIRGLTAEVRAAQADARNAQNRPTNWGWVLTGLGTTATIAALIGGIAYTAMNNQTQANHKRIERNEDALISMSDLLMDIRSSRWSIDDHNSYERDRQSITDRRFKDIQMELDQLEDRIHNHQRDGHPQAVIDRLEFIKDIAERADLRSEQNSLKLTENH